MKPANDVQVHVVAAEVHLDAGLEHRDQEQQTVEGVPETAALRRAVLRVHLAEEGLELG